MTKADWGFCDTWGFHRIKPEKEKDMSEIDNIRNQQIDNERLRGPMRIVPPKDAMDKALELSDKVKELQSSLSKAQKGLSLATEALEKIEMNEDIKGVIYFTVKTALEKIKELMK